jgi:hypothetical protein
MELIQDIVADNDFWVFVLLTVFMGGGAAWRTGQAVAESWGELWPVAAYTLLLAAAVRFLHYALFSGPLISAPHFAVDFGVLLVLALLGHRTRRARHMGEQYPWLVERSGVLGWRLRKT